ncbi:MAG: ArsR/SmtB family transcription factor [Desulfobulbaceae bacterium]
MEQTINLCKALTEPIRLRILALLGEGELCVCELVAVLQLPQSTVSRHLAMLKSAGWVTERRQGVWMYYRLAEGGTGLQAALQQNLLKHLNGLTQVKTDLARLPLMKAGQGPSICGDAFKNKKRK